MGRCFAGPKPHQTRALPWAKTAMRSRSLSESSQPVRSKPATSASVLSPVWNVSAMRQNHHIVALSAAHPLPAGDAGIAERGRLGHARKPRDVTCMTRQRNSTDHSSFQASIKANLTGFGLQRNLSGSCFAYPCQSVDCRLF